MKKNQLFKYSSVTLTWFWLVLFAIIPNALVFVASFLSHNNQQLITLPVTLINYQQLFNIVYLKIFLRSFNLAFTCTFICLIIGYPFAYFIARFKQKTRTILLLFIMIPFWTSSLIRTYAIMIVLKAKGLLNSLLLWLGVIHQPLQLLYSNTAVIIGLTYSLLPFMVLPLYASIEKLDNTLIEAAKDLGANRTTVFLKVTLPLTMPGIIAGILLVFLPAMTLFYIPALLGGAKSLLLGNLIENQFLRINNWPQGSATSALLIIVMSFMLLIYFPLRKRELNSHR